MRVQLPAKPFVSSACGLIALALAAALSPAAAAQHSLGPPPPQNTPDKPAKAKSATRPAGDLPPPAQLSPSQPVAVQPAPAAASPAFPSTLQPASQSAELPGKMRAIPPNPALVVAMPAPGGQQDKNVSPSPTTLVELPPTPMLDEHGEQRVDPDGKPMFNPPVRQQRDKRGHPLFDREGKPVMQTATELGYDEHGKKLKADKEPKRKTTSMAVTRGMLTVDGMVGKAALNYTIADLHYVYFYVPWIGTTVVSHEAFPGATEQQGAFDGNTLTVKVADHTIQLSSEERLLGKKPQPAYVLVDPVYRLPTRSPVMSYGSTRRAPYSWPGSRAEQAGTAAPPLPASLRSNPVQTACPAGTMRRAAPAGQAEVAQPCIPSAPTAPTPAPEAKP